MPKNPVRIYLRNIVVLGTAAFASVAHAGWVGDEAEFTYYVPTSSTQVAQQIEVLPNSFDLSGIIGVGGSSLDVTDTQIKATFGGSGSFSDASFNGWVLNIISKSDPDISGVTIDPSSNFGPPIITFTSKSVTVNWADIGFTESSVLLLDVQFGTPALPEPGSLALILCSLICSYLVQRLHPKLLGDPRASPTRTDNNDRVRQPS